MSHSFGHNDWDHDGEDATGGLSADQLLAQAKNRRQETLDVVRDSVSRMRQTEQTAIGSMEKLSEQSEKLHRTQRDLQNASVNERVAGEQVTEIKRLNRLLAFKNPFRNRTKEKAQRAAVEEERARERQRADAQVQESLYRSKQRLASTTSNDPSINGQAGPSHSSRHHFASAAIESDLWDEEDQRKESEIDQGLHDIAQVAGNLKAMALNMNTELQQQNRQISSLANSSDGLKVRLDSTNNRMKRIN